MGAQWSDAEREALLDAVREHGNDWARVAAMLNLQCDTARTENAIQQLLWAASMRAARDDALAEYRATRVSEIAADPAQQWTALNRKHESEVRDSRTREERLAESFDWLRPVELTPLPLVRAKYRAAPVTIVAGDFHFPVQDDRAVAVLLATVRALRPHRVILNGDLPDLMALSRYPKDSRRAHTWTLRDEQVAMKSFLRELYGIVRAWDGEIVEVEANHSGNGTASRWRRWLNENASALFGLDGVEEALSYERYFHVADVPMRMVEEVVLPGGLRVRHGEVIRKHGGYSARAHGDKWQASVMHSHTHRVGSSLKRVPAVPGFRDEAVLKTYEIGCMCRLDADYAPAADWSQGFAIVAEGESDCGVELVSIVDGAAVIVAMGGTVRAADWSGTVEREYVGVA